MHGDSDGVPGCVDNCDNCAPAHDKQERSGEQKFGRRRIQWLHQIRSRVDLVWWNATPNLILPSTCNPSSAAPKYKVKARQIQRAFALKETKSATNHDFVLIVNGSLSLNESGVSAGR